MSSIVTANSRTQPDHFEPQAQLDPQEQRRLRGHLEQIDYAAFAANCEILGKTLSNTDLAKFQRLAVSAAHARAQWVAAAISATEQSVAPTPQQVAQLTQMRLSYEELTSVYEALRRMVERGYLSYHAK